MIDISQSEEIFSVSRLNREVRFILEGSFPMIWVEGEISNLAIPNSGHWYFGLKDENSQVRGAMFRMHNRRLNFIPKDGMQVMIKARVSLYEGRGEFQLIAEHMEEVGEGKLRKAFEALKKRLLDEGLFDAAHKKSFPAIPKSIGVITSPTGAAIRDILSVLKRRFPAVPVIIYPTLVQGDTAAPNIVKALRIANQRNECDVLILARGGGSLEDLWPFNEEIVARAIFHSIIPIMSGVGHEIDFTIADFVADVRAPTPSAAAELITPDRDELLQLLTNHHTHITRLIIQKIRHHQQQISWMDKHLQQQHPKRRLHEQQQRLDLFEAALIRLQNKVITQRKSQLDTLQAKIAGLTPIHKITTYLQQLKMAEQRLQNQVNRHLQDQQQHIANLAGKLDALSPLATLYRGYAIVSKDEVVLRDTTGVKPGDKINVQLTKGSLDCSVDTVVTS